MKLPSFLFFFWRPRSVIRIANRLLSRFIGRQRKATNENTRKEKKRRKKRDAIRRWVEAAANRTVDDAWYHCCHSSFSPVSSLLLLLLLLLLLPLLLLLLMDFGRGGRGQAAVVIFGAPRGVFLFGVRSLFFRSFFSPPFRVVWCLMCSVPTFVTCEATSTAASDPAPSVGPAPRVFRVCDCLCVSVCGCVWVCVCVYRKRRRRRASRRRRHVQVARLHRAEMGWAGLPITLGIALGIAF